MYLLSWPTQTLFILCTAMTHGDVCRRSSCNIHEGKHLYIWTYTICLIASAKAGHDMHHCGSIHRHESSYKAWLWHFVYHSPISHCLQPASHSHTVVFMLRSMNRGWGLRAGDTEARLASLRLTAGFLVPPGSFTAETHAALARILLW